MSDVPRGAGWWRASDGRWYPPELRRRRPPPRTLAGDLRTGWGWFRSQRTGVQGAFGLGMILLVWVVAGRFGDDGESAVETTGPTGPTVTVVETTTTTAFVLPDGDDRAVARVIDGDSFVVDDGTRIRLIGVNTPEIETGECHSAEATARMRELLAPGTRVRLAYDEQRTDAFSRTLAYVYRLADKLFVNDVLAKDGYAREQTVAPNTRHADQFRTAVDEARTANRGLWSACTASTTTTTATTATTTTTTTTAAVASTVRPLSGGSAASTTVAVVPTTVASTPCHPSYAGACLPVGKGDVDCAPGSGNGPEYTSVNNFQVVGPDVFGLDADNDGIACET